MKFDFTVTVSVILAVCAIISPVITTFLNNRHLTRIREFDYKQMTLDKKENSIRSKFDIFSTYITSTSKYLTLANTESFKQYAQHYPIALLYMNNDEISNKMKSLHKLLSSSDFKSANLLLEEVISDIKEYINKLS